MATKGKKAVKVKWAIGGVEPDDLPDFQSNDDIVKKNKGALPPKGRTRVLVKRVTAKDKDGELQLMLPDAFVNRVDRFLASAQAAGVRP